MATDATRRRILEAAEQLFATEGYVATSHRRVADAADVNLAAIRYHFGTKRALFGAVLERRLRPLDEERLRRLESAQAKRHPRPPGVEDLVPALVAPMFEMAQEPKSGPRILQFLARARVEPGDHWNEAGKLQARMLKQFEKAFRAACPQLSPRSIAFRVSFFLGSIAVALIDEPTVRTAGGNPANLKPVLPQLERRLERLFVSGMKVPDGR